MKDETFLTIYSNLAEMIEVEKIRFMKISLMDENKSSDEDELSGQQECDKSDEDIDTGEWKIQVNLDGIKTISLNKIFARFLFKISKLISIECFKEICIFVCMIQSSLNKVGWDILQNMKPDVVFDNREEFCSINNGEFSIEVCNDFIIKFYNFLFFKRIIKN